MSHVSESEQKMGNDGLKRMLDFLNFLEDKNISYFISKFSPDGLTVTMTLVTVRVEVEFTPQEMKFSYFKGTEDVETDEKILYDLIKQYGE
jgi:hypothetical protein